MTAAANDMDAAGSTAHRIGEGMGVGIPAEDVALLRAAGYGRRMGPGLKPALLIVDFTYGFCGPRGMPIRTSIEEHRRACGEAAWRCVQPAACLLGQARTAGTPVVYSRMRDGDEPGFVAGLWPLKNERAGEPSAKVAGRRGENEILEELRPRAGEYVISKDAPSMFHGTNLLRYLSERAVDTVVVCGGVTSGCVYATVLDAFSCGLRPVVVADATFDRVESLHQTFLFDIGMKYGDVVTSRDIAGLVGWSPGASWSPAEGYE